MITDQLKAYFLMDESSGNAYDASGNGNTLTNAGSVAYASGKFGNAADFGTTVGHTKVLYKSGTGMFGLSLATGQAFSCAFWFKPRATPTGSSVGRTIDIGGSNGYLTIQYRNNGGTVQLDVAVGGGTGITYAVTLTNDTWYHIMVTVGTDNVARLYLNNSQVGSNGTNGGSASGVNAAIGNANNSPGSNANGVAAMFDEVGFWQKELTSDERAALYNSGTGLVFPFQEETYKQVAYYKLDESSGNAADATANAYTMTNNNTVGFSAGKLNNGADFGTSNTNKNFSRSDTLGLTTNSSINISVMAWAYFKTGFGNSDATEIFSIGVTNTFKMIFNIRGNSGGTAGADIECYMLGATGINNKVDYSFSLDTWYHLAWTIDSNIATFYVNGSAVGSISMSYPSNSSFTGVTKIGGGTIGSYMRGLIDELGVWSRKLTAAEVSYIYNSGTGKQYPFAHSTTYNQDVIATSTVAASVLKGMSKVLTAGSTVNASVLKQLSVALSASTAVTASIVKQIAKELAVTAAVTASMTAIRVFLVAMDAAANVTASIAKVPGKVLEATSNITASVTKTLSLSRTLTAAANVTAEVDKTLSKILTASANVAASITKIPGKVLAATASITSTIETVQAKVLTATANVTASIESSRAVVMEAAATVTATITKTPHKILAVVVSIIAKVKAPFYKTKYPSHGDGGEYNIKYDD